MAFDYQNIKLENKGNGIWLLTMNRPSALNALNAALLNEMAEAKTVVIADVEGGLRNSARFANQGNLPR